MKRILLAFYFLIAASQLLGQANTLIMGALDNTTFVKEIELKVDERFLDGKIKTYASNILSDGSFAFAAEIRTPQLVTLSYARNHAVLYLEPGDTLLIDGDANTFQYGLRFGGTSASNNLLLKQYQQKFPVTKDLFQYSNYKKGNVWLRNSPEMEILMRNNAPEEFIKKARRDREDKRLFVQMFNTNNPSSLSENFKAFIAAEIEYDWAYHVLVYGSVFDKKHQLDTSYFQYLDDIPLNANQIGSSAYQNYILAYINFLSTKNNIIPEYLYAVQYENATRHLEDLALRYLQSEIIQRGLKSKQGFDEVLPKYWDFLENNEYLEFDEKVSYAYQQATKYQAGSYAPDFTLKNEKGEYLSLSSFHGKAIYLNFWANWCRPCIKKMNDLQAHTSELEAKGVVIIYVSLDRDEEIWRNSTHAYKGIHLFAPGDMDSDIAKAYDVRAIPQFFLVDKEGYFAEKPERPTLTEIRYALLKLAK